MLTVLIKPETATTWSSLPVKRAANGAVHLVLPGNMGRRLDVKVLTGPGAPGPINKAARAALRSKLEERKRLRMDAHLEALWLPDP